MVMNFIRFKIGIISWVLIIVCMYICENHIYKNGAEEKYEAAQDSNLERYGVYGENVPIPYNIPLEEIAEKIEYLYTYEKMLCEVSASSQYEELEPLPEGTVISAAVPYYPPSEQEYESGKYYFTGGEWLPVANQEERIQKIKEMERVAILFTVIEREDYELAIPSWKSLFTEHGKAKGQLSHIL